jgi:hypothetical protein
MREQKYYFQTVVFLSFTGMNGNWEDQGERMVLLKKSYGNRFRG